LNKLPEFFANNRRWAEAMQTRRPGFVGTLAAQQAPRYRLAQLQDALLRSARFVVGIRMHTMGMTFGQAVDYFEKSGYQPRPVAISEAKRGTSDALYGYYTMGKLAILKLRGDYEQKTGPAFSLQEFNYRFIAVGPLPLPLEREAMLGERSALCQGRRSSAASRCVTNGGSTARTCASMGASAASSARRSSSMVGRCPVDAVAKGVRTLRRDARLWK
jgi:hypothetical protein